MLFWSSVRVLIQPSFILRLLSGITKSTSIWSFKPNPLQSGHAPYGALKLNVLGSSSARENSQYGQAKDSENTNSLWFSPSSSIITFPFDSLVAFSIASVSLG